MKRIVPLIFSIAIFVGIALPFSATLSTQHGVRLTANSVFAQAVKDDKTVQNTYKPPVDIQGYIEECAIFNWAKAGATMAGCVAQFVYIIPYELGSWAMAVAAQAFDAAAALTLSSTLYTSGDLLTKGWTVTRDFANIFFILILLFAALSLVLDMDLGGTNPKKMVSSVVIVAILINFSFFLTEVVVDVSNSLALVFYNQISVVQKDKVTKIDNTKEEEQLKNHNLIKNVKPISVAIASGFRPQIFNSEEFYEKLACARENGFFTNTIGCDKLDVDKRVASGVIIPILILVGCMYLVVAYTFGVALISLIGRMISLFIAIIFAPFAFVSTILPSTKRMPGFGWDEWFSNLMTAAFAAPIYFFLLLLVTFIVDIPIVPKNTTDMSAGIILVLVIIQCAIIITLLLKATSYVEKASGEIGGMILKGSKVIGGAAVGLAGGAALGGLALAGQSTIGAIGKRLGEHSRLTRWATDGGGGKNNFMNGLRRFTGEKFIKGGQFLGKSSFDARHTGVANALTSATGINLGSFGALAAKNTAGGLDGAAARKAEKDKKFAESLKYDEHRQEKIEETAEAREAAISKAERELNEAKADKDARKEDLQKKLDESQTKLNEAMSRVVRMGGSGQKEKDAAIAEAKKNYDNIQKELSENKNLIKAKQKNLNDLQKGRQDGDKYIDKDGNEKIFQARYQNDDIGKTKKADGTLVTKDDVEYKNKDGSIGRKRTEALSAKQLTDLVEGHKKSASRAYLAYQAESSGYHTAITRDQLGNVKSYHIDTSKAGSRNWGRAIMTVGSAALVGGLTGNIASLSTAFSAFNVSAASGFGIAAAIREAYSEAYGGRIGSSFVAGEAAHHAGVEGGKHDHEHGVYHTPGSGFLSQLAAIFKFKAGGGGGGGHGGGGGGGHH